VVRSLARIREEAPLPFCTVVEWDKDFDFSVLEQLSEHAPARAGLELPPPDRIAAFGTTIYLAR
jgi:hypothetical protein